MVGFVVSCHHLAMMFVQTYLLDRAYRTHHLFLSTE